MNTAPRIKILIFGKSGQVAKSLQAKSEYIANTVSLGRDSCDVTDLNAIKSAIDSVNPDIIINASAYTAVDKAESDIAAAENLNARAPAFMASICKKHSIPLIHYSTDYVFDGCKKDAYLESDITNPASVYGRTKRDGELEILNSGTAAFIFRTSWIFSNTGNNFVKTMQRLCRTQEELKVIADQFGAPTSSDAIAQATLFIIAQRLGNIASLKLRRGSELKQALCENFALFSGIYNLTCSGSTSWHGFATAIIEKERLAFGDAIKCKNIILLSTEEYPLPAKRPANSILSNEKLRQAFAIHMPTWQDELNRL